MSLRKALLEYRAARRSRPLQRDFPREACAVRADGKLGSSTKHRFWEIAGLEISKCRGNFTGRREIFLFRLLGDERVLLGSGPRAGKATGTYSTRPSSTTSEFRILGPDHVWLPELPTWHHLSMVTLAVRRRKTTRSQQAYRSLTTWPAHLSLQDSFEYRRNVTWCYRRWPQTQNALSSRILRNTSV